MALENRGLIMRRAQAAVLAHDWDAAEHLYKRLLGGDSKNIQLLSLLGDLYVKRGDDNKARICYAQVLNLDNNNYDALSALGGIYRRLNRYEESINVLRRALATHKDDTQTNYNMGFTYRRMEKWDEAIECFKFVIRENPRDVLAYNHLGAIYSLQKEFDKAVDSYSKGLQIDPNHPILHLNMARSLEAMGEANEADAEYQASLRSKPGWIEAVKGYSDFLVDRKNTTQAAELVKKAIVLYPENVDMQSLLGRIYLKQCDYENAAKTFEKAADIDENDLDAVRGLAAVYEKTDRVEEAIAAIKKAEDISSEDDSVEKQYAHLLLTANAVEEAGQKIRAVYGKNKEDPETLDLCGQYFVVKRDEAKAKSAWKKINNADPAYKEHEKSAAERYKQIGEMDKAQEHIEKYISENDSDAGAYMVLGSIEEKRGNNDIARECFRLATERDKDNVHARKEENRLTMITRYGDKPPAPNLTSDPCDTAPSYEASEEDELFDDDFFASDDNYFDDSDAKKNDESIFDEGGGAAKESIKGDAEAENDTSGKAALIEMTEDDKNDDFLRDFEEALSSDVHKKDALIEEEDRRDDGHDEAAECEAYRGEDIAEAESALDEPPSSPEPYVPYTATRDYAEEKELLGKMKEAAEKAWNSAQTAADNAQAAEATLRKIQEAQKAQEEQNKEVKEDDLSSSVSLYEVDTSSSLYPKELSLFVTLRNICTSLLDNDKKESFLHSRERVMLDYVIARLKGQKGLMSIASKFSPLEGTADGAAMAQKTDVKAVLNGLRTLSRSLADKSLSIALDNMASKVLDKQF